VPLLSTLFERPGGLAGVIGNVSLACADAPCSNSVRFRLAGYSLLTHTHTGPTGRAGSNVGEAVVLMSGPKGMANAALSKMFVNEGVKAEHLLFCDFFSRPY
jgi:hypothetical protein